MIPVQNIIKAYKSSSDQNKNRPHKLDINTDDKSEREKLLKNTKKSFADLLQQKIRS